MINIVIPMAGHGSRFKADGYELPKPLIPVHGVPMIEVVIRNIKPRAEHKFIFLVLQKHLDEFSIDKKLKAIEPDCEVIIVDRVTEGAACTVLLAKKIIDNKNALMIANSDQWVDFDINDYLDSMVEENSDGLIMTMWADHPKWSYVGFDGDGKVNRVVEKLVISNEATVGIYNFKHGSDFVSAAETMIAKNLRVNNEFYVAPAYNEMIEKGKKITVFNIGKECDGMYGMGIPSDLKWFLNNTISLRAVGKNSL